jgi:hypothetical protein
VATLVNLGKLYSIGGSISVAILTDLVISYRIGGSISVDIKHAFDLDLSERGPLITFLFPTSVIHEKVNIASMTTESKEFLSFFILSLLIIYLN